MPLLDSVLPGHLAVAAFEGWNDAGNAASGALEHLADVWHAEEIAELDAEKYYDFQVARPLVSMGKDGKRQLEWPSTRVFAATTQAGEEIFLVRGLEPSMRWPSYCRDLLRILDDEGAGSLVSLGALLADVPHTRPIPVSSSSSDIVVREQLKVEASEYEGPTGIVGVLDHAAQEAGLATVSIWAAVPHYVAQSPSPMATMALLSELGNLSGLHIPLGDLPDESRAWQDGVAELSSSDPDIAQYVAELEKAKDALDSPDATGEAIAKEFEKFLRNRDDGRGWQRGV
jgi:hypothetical protein